MIQDKGDLQQYLRADGVANGLQAWKWHYRFVHPIVHFQRTLRRAEYYQNCRTDLIGRGVLLWLRWRLRRMSMLLGFTIPRNVFGPGLSIAHYGSIVVNSRAQVGANCRIHVGVSIGEHRGQAPVLGDNVYLGPGAKLYGGIHVGNNVVVGANAVVNRDVPDNVTVAGVPARIVSENGRTK